MLALLNSMLEKGILPSRTPKFLSWAVLAFRQYRILKAKRWNCENVRNLGGRYLRKVLRVNKDEHCWSPFQFFTPCQWKSKALWFFLMMAHVPWSHSFSREKQRTTSIVEAFILSISFLLTFILSYPTKSF